MLVGDRVGVGIMSTNQHVLPGVTHNVSWSMCSGPLQALPGLVPRTSVLRCF